MIAEKSKETCVEQYGTLNNTVGQTAKTVGSMKDRIQLLDQRFESNLGCYWIGDSSVKYAQSYYEEKRLIPLYTRSLVS